MHRALTSLVLASLLAVACGSTADEPASPPASDGLTSTSSTGAPTTTTTTLVAASGECGLEGSYPAPWPERPRYQAVLDVDVVGGVVEGEMEVEFTPPEDTDRLVFRLWANMPRVGSGGGSLEVTEALLEGEPVETSYEDGNGVPGTPGTILNVLGDFRAGRTTSAFLAFRLEMPGPVNERVAKVGESLRLGSILPLLGWIRGDGWHTSPAVTNFSEAVASEVADFDVTLRVPEGFDVMAVGEQVEPGRFVAPAVRDWAATVARMEIVEDMAADGRTTVRVGVAEGAARSPDVVLADTVASLDDFAARYGPYPYPELSVGVTGSLSGGIEFPGHFQLGDSAARRSLIHEVAHMWFYALVGNDQYGDPWLDEGLATYAESRFIGNLGGRQATTIPAYGRGRLGEGHDYWAADTSAFFRSVYVQGAQALADVGDAAGGQDALDCGLRRYVLENAHTVAEPDDLIDALSEQLDVDPVPILSDYGAI